MQLLKGLDPSKDQTYFLASIQPQALERVLFPVGGMLKGAVRELAAERGLLPADRRSSAGICFIGGWGICFPLCGDGVRGSYEQGIYFLGAGVVGGS